MNREEQMIHDFYAAFSRRDAKAMVRCYHPDITFSDPVFPGLQRDEVIAMWDMLTAKSNDLKISAANIAATDKSGRCEWHANYTFTKTGRLVTNHVRAEFEFKDGLISRHVDHFDFPLWLRQAFGFPALLFGNFLPFQNKVRKVAAASLQHHMNRHSKR